ncbi:ABC transporter ATP-binding protein [Bordetella holmesii]|nr:ABC transporter ATP-binding protein [Bordetella holmesii]
MAAPSGGKHCSTGESPSRCTRGSGYNAPFANPARALESSQGRPVTHPLPMPVSTSNSSDLVLSCKDVALGYGDFTVLYGITLEVSAGEVVAIMGGSGSGKTTLLRAATGQIVAQRGQVLAFGQDVAAASAQTLQGLRKRMGVLFQQGALFTDLNVYENVAFPLREHTSCSEAEILDKVLDKLDAVGLRAAAHLRVAEISGGMARRVALARAVVLEPELILYDEPFAGLDPISMGITARLIRHLSDRLHCASVLITHDIQESFAIADRVYLVGQGQMKAWGTPETLSGSEDPYVRQFLDGAPDGPVAFRYPETPAFEAWLGQQQGRKS